MALSRGLTMKGNTKPPFGKDESDETQSLYSKANVVNSLMDKIAHKCAIDPKPTEPTHKHRADDLLDRLNLIKNWR